MFRGLLSRLGCGRAVLSLRLVHGFGRLARRLGSLASCLLTSVIGSLAGGSIEFLGEALCLSCNVTLAFTGVCRLSIGRALSRFANLLAKLALLLGQVSG